MLLKSVNKNLWGICVDIKRAFWGIITSFFITTVFLLVYIPFLKKKRAGQEILCYVKEHKSKSGTPTMGGIAFVLSTVLVSFLFFQGQKRLAFLALAVFLAYGVTGFLDDFLKIKNKRNLGLRAYQKVILQLGIAFILAFFCYDNALLSGSLILPFGYGEVDIGWWIVPLVIFIFLAMSNGVNLTDGLDGLATISSLLYFLASSAFIGILAKEAHESGRIMIFEEYQNLSIVCFCLVGSLFSFLIFNSFPAKIFMGDTGSLAIGALCAVVLILSKLTLLVPFLGVTFLLSCVSVIVQVVGYKSTKKRLLLKAPYHHHLQLCGLSETRISVLYGTITAIVCLICFIFWF